MRTTLGGWDRDVSVVSRKFNNLLYATDPILFTTQEEIVELINLVDILSIGNGLLLNGSKTKVMIIDDLTTVIEICRGGDTGKNSYTYFK